MIKELVDGAMEAVKKMTKKLLGQELVKQYTNPAPKNKYACFFTAFFMYFRHVHGLKMTFMEYREACLANGAINDAFTIQNHNKMCAAAGFPNLVVKNTNARLREKIMELILLEKPVIFSLNGEHYESIDGYEIVDGVLRFTVDDPGWQDDTYATGDTLEVYREDKGQKKFSVNAKGAKRAITRVYWMEQA